MNSALLNAESTPDTQKCEQETTTKFVQQILMEQLLYVRSHSRPWGYCSQQETEIPALVVLTY